MNEYIENYSLDKGFTDIEKQEFNNVLGCCSFFDTVNNIDIQNTLYNLIKSIIDNSNIDYLSKLYKIEMLLNMNKSLKEYHKEMWDYSNMDIVNQK